MIEEIDKLIDKYNSIYNNFLLPYEQSITAKTTFYNEILSYVVKYRPIACPNEYFTKQLINIL